MRRLLALLRSLLGKSHVSHEEGVEIVHLQTTMTADIDMR